VRGPTVRIVIHLNEGTTLHLTPKDAWDRQAANEEYLPEAYASDGFIHCTNGDENLLEVANRYYRLDQREFVVLTIDVGRIASEVKYEDPDQIYPHIYGPLNTSAVVGLRKVERSKEGAFVRFED
jgi:uncharacterized protein (DUF952 family)